MLRSNSKSKRSHRGQKLERKMTRRNRESIWITRFLKKKIVKPIGKFVRCRLKLYCGKLVSHDFRYDRRAVFVRLSIRSAYITFLFFSFPFIPYSASFVYEYLVIYWIFQHCNRFLLLISFIMEKYTAAESTLASGKHSFPYWIIFFFS